MIIAVKPEVQTRGRPPRGDSGAPLQHELGFGPGRALTGSRDRDGG